MSDIVLNYVAHAGGGPRGKAFNLITIMAYYIKDYSETYHVYFPRAVVMGEPVSTDDVAAELADRSTVSRSDVRAVLGDIAKVLANFMKQGKSVRIEGLGTFRYVLETEGVENEADFDFSKQVKAVRVRFIPEKTYSRRGETATRSLVSGSIEWIELPPEAVGGKPGSSGGAATDDDEELGGEGSFG